MFNNVTLEFKTEEVSRSANWKSLVLRRALLCNANKLAAKLYPSLDYSMRIKRREKMPLQTFLVLF